MGMRGHDTAHARRRGRGLGSPLQPESIRPIARKRFHHVRGCWVEGFDGMRKRISGVVCQIATGKSYSAQEITPQKPYSLWFQISRCQILPFQISHTFQITFQISLFRFRCYRKMIMSYFCKVEMSYSGNATLLLFQRRQDGGRGHHHGAPKGTEAAACDPQGDGRNAYTKGCSRAYLVDREADPSHREADTPRRG